MAPPLSAQKIRGTRGASRNIRSTCVEPSFKPTCRNTGAVNYFAPDSITVYVCPAMVIVPVTIMELTLVDTL